MPAAAALLLVLLRRPIGNLVIKNLVLLLNWDLKIRQGAIVQNIVNNLCAKCNHDRMRDGKVAA